MTAKTTGEAAYAIALAKIEELETALAGARGERVVAIEQMRDEGMTWAQIEEITGITRQRLNTLVRCGPGG